MRVVVCAAAVIALSACGPSAAEREAEAARVEFDSKVQQALDSVKSEITDPGEVRFSGLSLVAGNVCGFANGKRFAVTDGVAVIEVASRNSPSIYPPATGYAGAMVLDRMQTDFTHDAVAFETQQVVSKSCSLLAGASRPIPEDPERPGHYLKPAGAPD